MTVATTPSEDSTIPEAVSTALESDYLEENLPSSLKKTYDRISHEAAQTITKQGDQAILRTHLLTVFFAPSAREDRMFIGLFREDFTHGFFVPETVAFAIASEILSREATHTVETNEWFDEQLF